MPSRELQSRDLRRLVLAGGDIDYVLVRRRGRRGVGLKVDEMGLTVSAPVTMPLARVESLLRESERWVLRKIAEWRHRRAEPLAWVDGARLPLLGGALTLRLENGARGRATRVDGELRVTARAGDADITRRVVVAWYKAAAQAHLAERVAALAA